MSCAPRKRRKFSRRNLNSPRQGLTGHHHLKWWKRILFWFERIPRRLTRIPDSPQDIAKAFAVGVFIGIIPGLGALTALLAAMAFRLSKGAAVLGSLTTNPWTVAPLYALSYKVGKLILRLETPIDWPTLYKFNIGWSEELRKAFPPVITGGAVLGLIASFSSYFIVLFLLKKYRKVRLKRLHVPI